MNKRIYRLANEVKEVLQQFRQALVAEELPHGELCKLAEEVRSQSSVLYRAFSEVESRAEEPAFKRAEELAVEGWFVTDPDRESDFLCGILGHKWGMRYDIRPSFCSEYAGVVPRDGAVEFPHCTHEGRGLSWSIITHLRDITEERELAPLDTDQSKAA